MDCGVKDPNVICRQPHCASCKDKKERVASGSPDISTDPKAQEVLEQFVKQEMLVVLVHIPTRMTTSKHTELKNVRNWCEQAVAAFGEKADQSEFLVVEIRKSGVVRTTTLTEWSETEKHFGFAPAVKPQQES